jgi:hypothetical protein
MLRRQGHVLGLLLHGPSAGRRAGRLRDFGRAPFVSDERGSRLRLALGFQTHGVRWSYDSPITVEHRINSQAFIPCDPRRVRAAGQGTTSRVHGREQLRWLAIPGRGAKNRDKK